jgi:uncharacterized membrane protein YbhN (UPF0104 family)
MRRPGAWTAARWALGIGVLALLLVGLNGAEIAARIASANTLLVVIGVLGLTAVHALGAAAWRILCRRLGGLRLAWATCLRVYYAAQALGGVTPANIGGDAYRVLAVRKAGLGWSAAVAPVLVQRASSYLALAIVAFPALLWLMISSRVPGAVMAAGLVLCALAGGFALVLLAAPGRLAALRARLPWHAAPGGGGPPVDPAAWARPAIGSVAVATGFGLAFHLGSVLLTGLLLVAVDPSASGISVLAAITVARLSLAVPILPSGLGANEAILSLLFASLGLAPQTALAGLLLGRVAMVLTTLVGAALLVGGQQEISRGDARGAPQQASVPPL